MVTAYVLMTLKPGADTKVAESLVRREEVADINIVYGSYDIIMKLVVKDMAALEQFMIELRNELPNIESTSTLIAIK